MTLKLDIINPLNHSGWDDSLTSLPGYNFFYSSAWAKVLAESYQYKPTYFTLTDSHNLLAIIPVMEINNIFLGRRGVSLPFTDYCEPIANEISLFKEIFNRISAYGKKRKWKFFELRGGGTFLDNTPSACYYFGHTVDLSQGENHIFSRFRDSTKRNIKKAISAGVEVKICNSLESIIEFYRLNCMTRKRHGLPPQPYHFFKKVYDHVISKDLGVAVLASFFHESAIAGAVFFHFGEKAVFKYGASDTTYQNLRGNNLVMWEAIKWYCKRGYKSMCLGRTEPENLGLKQFKIGWGAQERIINYYRYDLGKGTFVKDSPHLMGSYKNLLQKIPIPLLKMVGLIMYRHVG